jgi:ribonuclease III
MKREPDGTPRVEEALGHPFRDKELLRRALTPPSSGLEPNNQRMEFLGDALLQSSMSELIFREKPDWDEGAMSKLRGMLVCTQTLCEWAQSLGLALRTGPRSTKRESGSLVRKPMADAMEAVIAAVFLDAEQAGDDPRRAVSGLVESRFLAAVRHAYPGIWQERDSKTTLQEWAAAQSLPPPVYELLERGGPDHAPVFTVRVRAGGHEAEAAAGTLKGAQAEAARVILKELRNGKAQSSLPSKRPMG